MAPTEPEWTSAEDDQLIAEIEQLKRWPEIADSLGRKAKSCIVRAGHVLLRELNSAASTSSVDSDAQWPKKTVWESSDDDRLLELVTQNTSWVDIAEQFGASPAKCRKRAEGAVLSRYQQALLDDREAAIAGRGSAKMTHHPLDKELPPRKLFGSESVANPDARLVEIQETLRAILALIDERFPDVQGALRPGATASAIAAAESKLGGFLPHSLRAAYLLHDGAISTKDIFFHESMWGWHPLDAMVAKTVERRALAVEYSEVDDIDWTNAIIVSDPATADIFFVSMVNDPAHDSEFRQILHEKHESTVLAPTFGHYLGITLAALTDPTVEIMSDTVTNRLGNVHAHLIYEDEY